MKEKTIEEFADMVLSRLEERERINAIAYAVVQVLEARGLVRARPQAGEPTGKGGGGQERVDRGQVTGDREKKAEGGKTVGEKKRGKAKREDRPIR